MVDISSKFRLGLRVARHYPCVDTESEGGFSQGFVLLSFQILKPSIRQLSYWLSWIESRSLLPHECRLRKSSLRGRLAGDRPSQEGRDEPEYPKPLINSQVASFAALHSLNGVKRLPLNVNLRTRVVLDIQVWLPPREKDERSHP